MFKPFFIVCIITGLGEPVNECDVYDSGQQFFSKEACYDTARARKIDLTRGLADRGQYVVIQEICRDE